MTEMLSVRSTSDIASVAALADSIWRQHYVPIIGRRQTDYMLAKFQSAPAIARQISDGYQYFIAMDSGGHAGYFAFVPNPAGRTALLSKIYVRQERRGDGIGRAILAFVEQRCVEMGILELWLTVNRHNADSIAFYRHTGFEVSGEVVQDIGGGFFMDDYRMAKQCRRGGGDAR